MWSKRNTQVSPNLRWTVREQYTPETAAHHSIFCSSHPNIALFCWLLSDSFPTSSSPWHHHHFSFRGQTSQIPPLVSFEYHSLPWRYYVCCAMFSVVKNLTKAFSQIKLVFSQRREMTSEIFSADEPCRSYAHSCAWIHNHTFTAKTTSHSAPFLSSPSLLLLNLYLTIMCLLIWERERDVRQKHWSVASHPCPNEGLNWQPFGAQYNATTHWPTWPGPSSLSSFSLFLPLIFLLTKRR